MERQWVKFPWDLYWENKTYEPKRLKNNCRERSLHVKMLGSARFERERMQLDYAIILLNKILRNHFLFESLQWNYVSFNQLPLFISCAITAFCHIVKLSAISQTRQFQLFSTDLPSIFWKIAWPLGEIKDTVSLRFGSFPATSTQK